MFVRSILAMSLSCIFAGSAIAASTAEQSLNPQQIKDIAIEDPIDPLAVNNSAEQASSEAKITPQEQQDLNQASETLDNLQNTEDETAAIGTAPSSTTTTESPSAASKGSWSLASLNNAQWSENIGRGQFPVYARAHVMLNNAHASPGAIDGSSGKNTLKAIASFQQMHGLKPTGT